MSAFVCNQYRCTSPEWGSDIRASFEDSQITEVHRSLPEYLPTPLTSLPALAQELGIGEIAVKDEAHRFGLKAFKALGATWAIYRFIRTYLEAKGGSCPPAREFYREPSIPSETFTFCTATDGNHGRGVAWVARKLRQRAVIYMPKDSTIARIESIRSDGAEVIVVHGGYDDAVARCRTDAMKHGWQIISDTSWPGYEEIPRWIQAGYLTMFEEIHEDISEHLDVVIVPAGVGALAAAAAWYYNRAHPDSQTRLVSAEPETANCVMQSIQSEHGEPITIAGTPSSIMAGLNCGTPSPAAWPFVKEGYDLFMTVTDDSAREAMRTYYHPRGDDPRIVSGESGAASLAALLTLCHDPAFTNARFFLNLFRKSRVLLLNTEGDTDPAGFGEIVSQ